jgi:hypothetical protein
MAIVLVALAASTYTSGARAQGDLECARYQDPLAYNNCLARRGPKANDLATHPANVERGYIAPGRSERTAVRKTAITQRRWPRSTHAPVRAHMEFPVK